MGVAEVDREWQYDPWRTDALGAQWEQIVMDVYRATGQPLSDTTPLDHPSLAALCGALVQFYESKEYESVEELSLAVVHVWTHSRSPATFVPTDTWRRIFRTTGQIEWRRAVPTEPTLAYRIAIPDNAKGWSWTTDPWQIFADPRRVNHSMAPHGAFEVAKRTFPDACWYTTTIQPEQVRLATAASQRLFGLIGWYDILATDELVIDPATLGQVDQVLTEDIRQQFFSSAVFDRESKQWFKNTETHQAERARQSALGREQVK